MKLGQEFHFSEQTANKTFAFLAAIDSFDFEIHALVIPKAKLWSPRLRNDGTWFRQYFYKTLLASPRTPLSNSHVVIDKVDVLDAKIDEARRYLLTEVNQNSVRIRKLEFVESHDENLIQAADMCAGAIRASYEHQKMQYRPLIQNKIKDEWLFL